MEQLQWGYHLEVELEKKIHIQIGEIVTEPLLLKNVKDIIKYIAEYRKFHGEIPYLVKKYMTFQKLHEYSPTGH